MRSSEEGGGGGGGMRKNISENDKLLWKVDVRNIWM